MKTRPARKKTSKAETLALIRSARGMFKRKPGEKPFAEEWAEHKAGEMALEEAKLVRMERAGLLPVTRNSSRSKRKSKSTG